MKECKIKDKKKLLKFMKNGENRMLVIWFLTLVTYILLFLFFKNQIVLFFGYFVCYFVYSRLYNFVVNKLSSEVLVREGKTIYAGDEIRKNVVFSSHEGDSPLGQKEKRGKN